MYMTRRLYPRVQRLKTRAEITKQRKVEDIIDPEVKKEKTDFLLTPKLY